MPLPLVVPLGVVNGLEVSAAAVVALPATEAAIVIGVATEEEKGEVRGEVFEEVIETVIGGVIGVTEAKEGVTGGVTSAGDLGLVMIEEVADEGKSVRGRGRRGVEETVREGREKKEVIARLIEVYEGDEQVVLCAVREAEE